MGKDVSILFDRRFIVLFTLCIIIFIVILQLVSYTFIQNTAKSITIDDIEYIVTTNESYETNENKYTHNESSITSNKLIFKHWKLVYFQHIRKTGGTSMGKLLSQGNKLEPYISNDPFMPFKTLKMNALSTNSQYLPIEYIPFYTFSYLEYKYNLWNDILLITLIRNPLQRVFSDMIYQGQWKCNNIKYAKLKREMKDMKSLERKFIECLYKKENKFTSNIYIKIFSGVWSYGYPDKRLMENGIDFNKNIIIDNMHYELAKLILNEFDVILILEMFDETKLQLKCNGLYNDSLSIMNIGSVKHKLNLNLDMFPKLKKEMIKLNGYDIKLYEWAKGKALDNVSKCKQLYRNT
eukprot:428093_1